MHGNQTTGFSANRRATHSLRFPAPARFAEADKLAGREGEVRGSGKEGKKRGLLGQKHLTSV